jgi:hypothetical protein
MADEIVFPLTITKQEIAAPISGSRGPRGYSAYQVAVANGFEGTEAEWLYSLAASATADSAILIAAEALGGHRVVSVFDGLASYAVRATDYDSRLGLTTQAAAQDDQVVILFSGPIIEPSWSFTPGPVFVGDSGLLTQTIPATGPIIRIGLATSATTMVVNQHPPIMRQ